MSNYNAPQEINSWLDGVALPPEIRTVVYDEAVSLYSKLDENIPDVERKELAKAALMISCDPYSTALTVDMPKPRFNVMAEARKVTGILPAESIQKVDAMVALLKWEGAINNDDAKEFTDKTIEILSKYKEKDIHSYNSRPSVNAVAAIRISSELLKKTITELDLKNVLGVSEYSIREKQREIENLLNIWTSLGA